MLKIRLRIKFDFGVKSLEFSGTSDKKTRNRSQIRTIPFGQLTTSSPTSFTTKSAQIFGTAVPIRAVLKISMFLQQLYLEYPIGWQNQFGMTFNEHKKSMLVNFFEGYAIYSIKDNNAVRQNTADFNTNDQSDGTGGRRCEQ